MTTDPIATATGRGAAFEQRGAEWVALLRKRGRPLPLVQFIAPTQREAAEMFVTYTSKR